MERSKYLFITHPYKLRLWNIGLLLAKGRGFTRAFYQASLSFALSYQQLGQLTVILLILMMFNLVGYAQNRAQMYHFFINGNMQDWKKEIDSVENTLQISNNDKLNLINNQIGYIGWCIGEEKYDEAKQYIKLSQAHLETLENAQFKLSYVQSYQGALNGLKIGLNPFSAIFLGPGIVSKAKQAIELDPNNPNAYILLGNSKYYMWAMLGGSKPEALKYYKKAEQIIEQTTEGTIDNWNYLTLLTMIAYAYVEMGDYEEANNYYKKILNVEPNYQWIKEEVYPQFLKTYEKE